MCDKKAEVLQKCEEYIHTFNPVTHSIDTHIETQLAKKSKLSTTEKAFIQQVVYGWFREKAGIESFIDNFFSDCAAMVSRADKGLYTVIAYIAIFRLDEIGWHHFKEFVITQDPTKMCSIISYLFNTENLWSILRAGWIKIYDLAYVEDELIAGIEMYIKDADRYTGDLQLKAQGMAAAQAAKEEAAKTGTAGLGQVKAKALTKPSSPRLTRARPPKFKEPIAIEQTVEVHEVPGYLDRTSVAQLKEEGSKRLEETRVKTHAQYDDKYHFKLNETKNGKKLDDLRREKEIAEAKELAFDASFVNEPPDFNQIKGKVRLNATSILREDALYKKQQAKDVQLIQNYEQELRDPSEYYAWQKEMKDRDEVVKLKQVAMRREQAKQSSEEAREAMAKQRDDNKTVGDILRQQAEAIALQKQIEREIKTLENQELVSAVSQVRDTKPQESRERVFKDKVNQGKELREVLEEKRLAKEVEDKLEEERRADQIRQLRAVNTVKKQHIVVFDPTETAGVGVMDEMSFMEMKERLEIEKTKAATIEMNKRQEILEGKEKKAAELDKKAQNLMRARQVKAAANKNAIQRRKNQEKKLAEDKEEARKAAAELLDGELTNKRNQKAEEVAMLKAEADRVQRQQQYMGVAMGRVDEERAEQILLGQERQARTRQFRIKDEAVKMEKAKITDKLNRTEAKRKEIAAQKVEDEKKSEVALFERRAAVEKLKLDYQRKKAMVKKGHAQHDVTKKTVIESNLYASRINEASLTKSKAYTAGLPS
mmetsp:Transcript_15690/g.26154  ORF Transcript_15690/g.26154 Transcript_15690/m.26154 type:complete len:767 (+) Transcript_15690:121-2421(+)